MKSASLLVVLFLALGGCHMISADAVDGTLRGVIARHDAYVQKDAKLTAAQRQADLLDTQLLIADLNAAEGIATTQP